MLRLSGCYRNDKLIGGQTIQGTYYFGWFLSKLPIFLMQALNGGRTNNILLKISQKRLAFFKLLRWSSESNSFKWSTHGTGKERDLNRKQSLLRAKHRPEHCLFILLDPRHFSTTLFVHLRALALTIICLKINRNNSTLIALFSLVSQSWIEIFNYCFSRLAFWK